MTHTLNGVPSDKPFVHLILDPGLLERIDDFRFTFRYASRNAAIRFLIEAGLESDATSPDELRSYQNPDE